MTTDIGIPFLSVKMVSFCAQFAYISGITAGPRPPKGDFIDIESIDCHDQLIPILSSYALNSLIQIFLKTSILFHSWNLR